MARQFVNGSTSSDGVGENLWIGLLAIALLAAMFCGESHAKNRSSGRSSAAAAKARKQKMIKLTQQQLVVARSVLAAAESQSAMSQAEVTKANEQLSTIRESIKSARVDTREAAKTLHDLEAEIVRKQTSDSELARAQAVLEKAKEADHQIIHRVLSLPADHPKDSGAGRLADLAHLTPKDREKLEHDTSYQIADDELKAAARNVNRIRQKLLEADPGWVAAHEELAAAEEGAHEGDQHSHTAALGSLGDRQDLRKANAVVAAARDAIAQGEARLRQLGVNPAAGQGKPSTGTKP